MSFRHDNRDRMTRRDLGLALAMLCLGWLAVIGAIRVGSIIAGWLQ